MIEPPAVLVPCTTCGRELYQRTLGRALLACPTCKPSHLPYNPDALRRVARNERKRIKARVAVAVVRVLSEEQLGFRKWPADLITTVHVLDRWGAFGTGLPAQNPDIYRQSLPVPLDPDTQAVVTQCIGPDPMARSQRSHVPDALPTREQSITYDPCLRLVTYDVWWRGAPTSHVGQKIGMERRTFGRYLEKCLRVHRSAFLRSGHADLVALIGERP
jgi:hypothetical protein